MEKRQRRELLWSTIGFASTAFLVVLILSPVPELLWVAVGVDGFLAALFVLEVIDILRRD